MIELWQVSLDHAVEEPFVGRACSVVWVIHLLVVVFVEVFLLFESEAVLLRNLGEVVELDEVLRDVLHLLVCDLLLAHGITEVEVVLETEWAVARVERVLAEDDAEELVADRQVLRSASLSDLAHEAI